MATDTTTTEEEMALAPFSAFLVAHRKGLFNEELTEQLAQLVKAVQEHKKKGTLTITIDVRPHEANSGKLLEDVVIITDDVVIKPPRAARDASLWFPDEVGNLNRNPITPQLEGMRAIKGGKDKATNTDEGAKAQ